VFSPVAGTRPWNVYNLRSSGGRRKVFENSSLEIVPEARRLAEVAIRTRKYHILQPGLSIAGKAWRTFYFSAVEMRHQTKPNLAGCDVREIELCLFNSFNRKGGGRRLKDPQTKLKRSAGEESCLTISNFRSNCNWLWWEESTAAIPFLA
jgi:hypothetical protein